MKIKIPNFFKRKNGVTVLFLSNYEKIRKYLKMVPDI